MFPSKKSSLVRAITLLLLLGACPGPIGVDEVTETQTATDSTSTSAVTSASASTTDSGEWTTGAPTTSDVTSSASMTGVVTTGDATTGDATSSASMTGVVTTGDATTGDATSSASMTGVVTTGDATTGEASTGEPPACEVVACNGKILECGDCIDNDDDGVVDSLDVECISPCDDDESSFATGIPGDGKDPCKQDCFFDGNSGAGDDHCEWTLKCDPQSPTDGKCGYDPSLECADQQPELCLELCQPPPGCDCFGCCSVFKDGELHDVFLGTKGCSIDNFDACQACTQSESCAPPPCDPESCVPCINQPLPDHCAADECALDLPSCVANEECEGWPTLQYCDLDLHCCRPIPQ